MKQPQGFEDSVHPSHVCKLSKALYGLKQAPRAWFEKLHQTLLQWGFLQSRVEPCLFFLVFFFILIYVDDIIITANRREFLIEFTRKLHTVFALKDLGPLHFFLGIQVSRGSYGFFLNQSKYAQDILHKFSMDHVIACPTPMVINLSLSATEREPLRDPIPYRQAIGSLQYLTYTRPVLTFVVNRLSQFLQQPTDAYWKAIKRIFRYLKDTLNAGVYVKAEVSTLFSSMNSNQFSLIGYSDANWATCRDDWKSIGGHCVYLGGSLVSWSSKKQNVVARSSTESEYRSLSNLAADVVCVRNG